METAAHEVFGWSWIVVGFASGAWLGLRFHEDGWLGGYASLTRRLLRLAHISCVALGMSNILFALSARGVAPGPWLGVASWAILAGSVLMPAACVVTAWRRAARPIFVLPVATLVVGALLLVGSLALSKEALSP